MSHAKHSGIRCASVLAAVLAAACGPASRVAAAQVPPGHPHTAADVSFMSDMIVHHAQAVHIAGWAAAHEASAAVRRLCERIVVGQQDEIAILTRWLQDRGEAVPDPDAHAGHAMPMPGMLSAEDLAGLDSARGPGFDRLFLTMMIRHHQGALVMVKQLFAAQAAGQDQTVFRIATDVHADQTAEIGRMQTMLAALPPGGEGR